MSLTLPALGLPNFNQAARIALFELNQGIAGNTYVDFSTTVRGLKLRPGDLITVTYLKEGFERQSFRVTKVAPGMNYTTAQITAQIHDDAWYDDDNSDPFASGSTGRQPAYGIGMPRPLMGSVQDANGDPQLGITEQDTTGSDGTTQINLSVNFEPPTQPAIVGLGIPMVSLAAQFDSSSGQLPGNETLYYGVTEGNASGQESNLSFVVRAAIPAGTNTNAVTLSGLSFTSDATCFNVYRGANPSELFRIAGNQPIAATFTDTGLSAALTPPPDPNYDHANMYWRLELQPEYAATIFGTTTIGNNTLGMAPNEYIGMTVRITEGTGAVQEQTITANDATTLTVSPAWTIQPDQTSQFVVAEAGWHFGAAGSCGPLVFEVPNQVGVTVHVNGRSANVQNYECAYALSLVTRWQITGGGLPVDTGVSGTPVFGLTTTNRGDVALATIAFQDLTNTHTISSATLTLRYWNELTSPSQILLGADVAVSDTTIQLDNCGECTGWRLHSDRLRGVAGTKRAQRRHAIPGQSRRRRQHGRDAHRTNTDLPPAPERSGGTIREEFLWQPRERELQLLHFAGGCENCERGAVRHQLARQQQCRDGVLHRVGRLRIEDLVRRAVFDSGGRVPCGADERGSAAGSPDHSRSAGHFRSG